MTYNEAVLALIGEANNEYVEKTFEFMNKTKKAKEKPSARKYLRYAAVFAAVALAVVLAVFVYNKTNPENNGNENNISDKQTEFIIENGVLVKYTGSAETVEIPDGVTRIAVTAFEDEEAAACIKTLTIGKDVEDIDDFALRPLGSLDNLLVDKDNTEFEFKYGFLVKKDGTYIVASSGANWDKRNADRAFEYLFLDLERDNPSELYNIKKVEIGNAMIRIGCRNTEDNVKNLSCYFYVESVTFLGKTVYFSDGDEWERYIPIIDNAYFVAFEAGDVFVIGSVGRIDGKTFFITKDHLIRVDEYQNNSEDIYLRTHITFYTEGGKIYYSRIPHKYIICRQVVGGVCDMCVARDEMYSEIGLVEIYEDEITYYPQKIITIEEEFDLEAEYQKWSEMWKLDMSLDEYLEENSKKYERAR